MDIKQVVITGDSAGGHLALGVALMCVLRNFRKPDGVVLLYPACHGNLNHFMPSNLLSIDEELLNYSLLRYVMSAFLRKGGDPTNNAVLSPIYAPETILA